MTTTMKPKPCGLGPQGALRPLSVGRSAGLRRSGPPHVHERSRTAGYPPSPWADLDTTALISRVRQPVAYVVTTSPMCCPVPFREPTDI